MKGNLYQKIIIILVITNLFLTSCLTTTIDTETNNKQQSEIAKESINEQSLESQQKNIAPDLPYKPGTWKQNTFTSEWFGFTYTPKSNMLLLSQTELRDLNAQHSLIIEGENAELYDYTKMQIAYEVIAEAKDGSINLEILAEKVFAEDLTVEQYAEILRNELLIVHEQDIVFKEDVFTLLGNTHYFTLSATIVVDGITSQKTIFLHRQGNRMATVSLHCPDSKTYEAILNCFSKSK